MQSKAFRQKLYLKRSALKTVRLGSFGDHSENTLRRAAAVASNALTYSNDSSPL